MIDLIKRYFKQYLSLKYRIVTDRFAGYECQVTLFGLFGTKWVVLIHNSVLRSH